MQISFDRVDLFKIFTVRYLECMNEEASNKDK